MVNIYPNIRELNNNELFQQTSQQNLEEMFLRYYMHSDIYERVKSPTTDSFVTRLQMVKRIEREREKRRSLVLSTINSFPRSQMRKEFNFFGLSLRVVSQTEPNNPALGLCQEPIISDKRRALREDQQASTKKRRFASSQL